MPIGRLCAEGRVTTSPTSNADLILADGRARAISIVYPYRLSRSTFESAKRSLVECRWPFSTPVHFATYPFLHRHCEPQHRTGVEAAGIEGHSAGLGGRAASP
jgi:hypothetical protein